MLQGTVDGSSSISIGIDTNKLMWQDISLKISRYSLMKVLKYLSLKYNYYEDHLAFIKRKLLEEGSTTAQHNFSFISVGLVAGGGRYPPQLGGPISP